MTKDQATNLKAAVDKLLASPDVKPFLEGMCHFRKPIFTGERDHALVAEGRRQVYLTLLTINEMEPVDIVALYAEKGE
jgi:hypothetical protein